MSSDLEAIVSLRHNRKRIVGVDTDPQIIVVQALFKRRYLKITKWSVRYVMSKELIFSEFGNPLDVVKMRESELPPLGAQDVLVRMLAAPVNPSDINTIQRKYATLAFSPTNNLKENISYISHGFLGRPIQTALKTRLTCNIFLKILKYQLIVLGKYPINLELPCVLGNEGVGIVEEIGGYVSDICPGNKVVVTTPAQGTWRDIAVFHESMLKVVPNYLRVVEAATLTVNPCTAFRMLTDFKPVRNSHMVVIQNGANSACGQNVIQICKAWRVKNVNIVRNRPHINELKCYLQSLGATYVLTEEELRTTNIFRDNQIDKPSLAINCVGGKTSLEMLRQLEPYGCMVTYGGMSREPVTIPTSVLIFKNLTVKGFWMAAWNQIACDSDKNVMLSELISLMVHRKLEAPVHKMVKFDEFAEALCRNLKGFQGHKFILDFC